MSIKQICFKVFEVLVFGKKEGGSENYQLLNTIVLLPVAVFSLSVNFFLFASSR